MTVPIEILHDAAPFKIGQRVAVNQARGGWRTDWQEEYRVVGILWDYRDGRGVRLAIASDDEIEHRMGYTDDFLSDDLIPIPEQP